MTPLWDDLRRELQNKIIEVQRIILQEGVCGNTIGPCSRVINRKMWRYLGFPYCEKGGSGKTCLFGGYSEKAIRIRLRNKMPFYKAIVWEYEPGMKNFRLLEIIGKPWTLKDRNNKISERSFIYSHYRGRVGILPKEESRLLNKFLQNRDGIDIETLYSGFEDSGENVWTNAKKAFGPQTAVGLRLDYISGFREWENSIALMALFYKKDFLNLPEEYDEKNEEIKVLTELAKTISYFATPVIISEIFRRKIYGRTFSLTTKDFL